MRTRLGTSHGYAGRLLHLRMGLRLPVIHAEAVMTHPLVEFIHSCLDADERIANEVSGLYEDSPGPGVWVHDDDYRHDSLMVTKRAVLDDVAAKRAILDQHRFYLGGGAREQLCQTCGGEGVMNVVSWPCNTIRLLASAYAHRDGFDPAWAVLDEVELW